MTLKREVSVDETNPAGRDSLPIEKARNLGPASGKLLRQVGVENLEQLRREGWEVVFDRLVRKFPESLNLNMAMALLGAIEDCDWRVLPPVLKREARAFVNNLRQELGGGGIE